MRETKMQTYCGHIFPIDKCEDIDRHNEVRREGLQKEGMKIGGHNSYFFSTTLHVVEVLRMPLRKQIFINLRTIVPRIRKYDRNSGQVIHTPHNFRTANITELH